jgi:hypothetical protein
MRAKYIILFIVLISSSCAKIEKKSIIIDTIPQGAIISVSEVDQKTKEVIEKEIGVSPVEFIIVPIVPQQTEQVSNLSQKDESVSKPAPTVVTKPKYTILATKDGYFKESSTILDYGKVLELGKFEIQLQESPLWAATEKSNATNEWMHLIVAKEISGGDIWQRVVDAVTRRFQELKEYDFNSGYLVSMPKTKRFDTKRGVFLLRTRFLATVMERDPLTYRLKIESHWSDAEGSKWSPYPRVFKEDAELVKELMERFQAY